MRRPSVIRPPRRMLSDIRRWWTISCRHCDHRLDLAPESKFEIPRYLIGKIYDENQAGLTGAAKLIPRHKRNQLPGADPADAARCFHQGVDDAAVAIRRQQLQRFQPESTSDNNSDHEKQAVWVRQTERQSHHRECREMFKLRACNDRTVFDRGQRPVYNEGEPQPACDNQYPLNHRRYISYNLPHLNR